MLQKLFQLCHFTHVKLQKPSLSITEVTQLMHSLLDVLRSEGIKATAEHFYTQCTQDRKTEDGGLGFEDSKAPRGWMRDEGRGRSGCDGAKEVVDWHKLCSEPKECLSIFR